MHEPTPAEISRFAHILFLVTIIGKLVLGVSQLLIALTIFWGLITKLPALARWFFQDELAENPTDFLANWILTQVGTLPSMDLTFYQTYFAAHGMLHVVVAGALLYGVGWAYPASIATLAVFVVIQMVEWAQVGGVVLLVLTAIDLIVIGLTWIEWRSRGPKQRG
ncbi:DUF2127 domain-containing protein [Yoonia sp. MH D7]